VSGKAGGRNELFRMLLIDIQTRYEEGEVDISGQCVSLDAMTS
jgi:hypothetical protein